MELHRLRRAGAEILIVQVVQVVVAVPGTALSCLCWREHTNARLRRDARLAGPAFSARARRLALERRGKDLFVQLRSFHFRTGDGRIVECIPRRRLVFWGHREFHPARSFGQRRRLDAISLVEHPMKNGICRFLVVIVVPALPGC